MPKRCRTVETEVQQSVDLFTLQSVAIRLGASPRAVVALIQPLLRFKGQLAPGAECGAWRRRDMAVTLKATHMAESEPPPDHRRVPD